MAATPAARASTLAAKSIACITVASFGADCEDDRDSSMVLAVAAVLPVVDTDETTGRTAVTAVRGGVVRVAGVLKKNAGYGSRKSSGDP
jgi:hypothetical protein